MCVFLTTFCYDYAKMWQPRAWSICYNSVVDQTYVKAEDGKQTVAQYVAQVAKENGANFSIKKFVRFETGEGLEKKEDNFADEVASMIK